MRKNLIAFTALLSLVASLSIRAQSDAEANSASASDSNRAWKVELIPSNAVTAGNTTITGKGTVYAWRYVMRGKDWKYRELCDATVTATMQATKADDGYTVHAYASGSIFKDQWIPYQVKPFVSRFSVTVDNQGNIRIVSIDGEPLPMVDGALRVVPTYKVHRVTDHTETLAFDVSAIYQEPDMRIDRRFLGLSWWSTWKGATGTNSVVTTLTFKAVKE